ncbi:MAG: sodium-translocating pyrophosphatase [Chloroflexota bacterium]
MGLIIISLACGLLGLGVAAILAAYVIRQERGPKSMTDISDAIQEGAQAFLGREYRVLAIVVVIVAVLLGLIPYVGWLVSIAFIFGAICSGLAGFFGMSIAVRANSRTAVAAEKSLSLGLKLAFRGGAVMGMSVVGIGLVGLSILYLAFRGLDNFAAIIPGFGFGASMVAVFARVGGGVYTKAADTGSDIVGKVEKGIPEDDPRNAAVIADLVGDNVGDVAGSGADLFESYVGAIIATTTLGALAVMSPGLGKALVPNRDIAWFLPMIIAAGGIIASIIGIFLVRAGEKTDIKILTSALRNGTLASSVLVVIFCFAAVKILGVDMGIFWAIVSGLIAGNIIGEATNYFTSYSYKPVMNIAKSAQTGGATLITSGFAYGLLSTIPSVILVVIAVLIAYGFADVYGIAIAGVGLLATLGIQDATDAYGPISDNAGGIVEMAGLPEDVRERTDALDALGNTTKAAGKGFAIGSAAITALALLLSFTTAVGIDASSANFLDPRFISGLFLGAMLPAVFTALSLLAVGTTAFAVVNEVRRQFREIPGIMEGTAKPEYAKAVDICTTAAIKQMILPGVITIISPVIVGILLGPFALAGFLIGALVTGFILAITLANAGGAWDNAKKYIETGVYGGKGSDAHKSAVIGDAVGDPMKDTAGPSLNIMIKLMSVICLVLAPVFMRLPGLF